MRTVLASCCEHTSKTMSLEQVSRLTHKLLQTGFDCIKSSNIITYLVYTLHTTSHKLRAQLAEMLAGLCFLGKDRGQPLHSILLSAFSDAKITYDEEFRFEHLLQSIAYREPSDEDVLAGGDEPALWEYRRTAIALVNTLTGLPDGVEDRVALRDELARRGFNEIITVRALFRVKAYISISKKPASRRSNTSVRLKIC